MEGFDPVREIRKMAAGEPERAGELWVKTAEEYLAVQIVDYIEWVIGLRVPRASLDAVLLAGPAQDHSEAVSRDLSTFTPGVGKCDRILQKLSQTHRLTPLFFPLAIPSTALQVFAHPTQEGDIEQSPFGDGPLLQRRTWRYEPSAVEGGMAHEPESPTSGSTEPRASTEETANQKAADRKKPPWRILALIVGVGVVLTILYGWSVRSGELLLLLLLLAMAAFVVGGLIGFLFGIPKALTDANAPKGEPQEGNPAPAANRLGYQPSTNLEQVSDWLTKILIGVGLVELGDLGAALGNLGDRVADSIQESVMGANVVAEVVVVAFAVVGFLSTFLWTRLYYGTIQALTDWDLLNGLALQQRQTDSAVTATKKAYAGLLETTTSLLSGTLVRPAATPGTPTSSPRGALREAPGAGLPATVQQKIDALMVEPANENTDPIAELFQETPSETNDRRFEGEIVADLKKALVVLLRVGARGASTLEGPVVFLLHPTFLERVVEVEAKDGVAETKVFTEGWFTAGAVVDGGKTVLTYDLRNLPGAPKWFVNQ